MLKDEEDRRLAAAVAEVVAAVAVVGEEPAVGRGGAPGCPQLVTRQHGVCLCPQPQPLPGREGQGRHRPDHQGWHGEVLLRQRRWRPRRGQQDTTQQQQDSARSDTDSGGRSTVATERDLVARLAGRSHITRTDNRGVKDLFLVRSLTAAAPDADDLLLSDAGRGQHPEARALDLRPRRQGGEARPARQMARPAHCRLGTGRRRARRPRPRGAAAAPTRATGWARPARSCGWCGVTACSGTRSWWSWTWRPASSKVLVSDTKGDFGSLEVQGPVYVKDGGDFIWFSERDGWGHYYLYRYDGTLKRQLTSGEWRSDAVVGRRQHQGHRVDSRRGARARRESRTTSISTGSIWPTRRIAAARSGQRQPHLDGVENGQCTCSTSRRESTSRTACAAARCTDRQGADGPRGHRPFTAEGDRLEAARTVPDTGGRWRHADLRQYVEAVRFRFDEEVSDHRQRLSGSADRIGQHQLHVQAAARSSSRNSASSSSRSAIAAATRPARRPTRTSATSTCATMRWPTRRPASNSSPRVIRGLTSTGWASSATPAADS